MLLKPHIHTIFPPCKLQRQLSICISGAHIRTVLSEPSCETQTVFLHPTSLQYSKSRAPRSHILHTGPSRQPTFASYVKKKVARIISIKLSDAFPSLFSFLFALFRK